jgi:predicted TIM-barrel enzyme
MAVVYSNTVKDNRLNVVNDAVNSKTYAAGTGAGSTGKLVIGTSALSGATGVLATIALQNPAFTESGQVLTLAGVPLSVSPSAGGTAAKAEIRNNADTTIVSGLTVGTSASDVIVNTVTVATGVPFQVNSGTITHG